MSAQFLADFGAEVIKVERPQGGDQARGVRSIKSLEIGDWNQYFLVNNRNKKSLVDRPAQARGAADHVPAGREGRRVPLDISPELLEGWNLSWEKLAEINPRLVYATNTGYGRFGGASRPSFDLTVQALTGIMARLGEPGQPPIYLGMGSGDCYGGIMSAFAIVTALYQRNRSGHGQCIDASLYGAQLFLGAPQLQAYLGGDTEAALQRSRRDAPNPLWNIYPTRGKWVCVCEPNEDARFRLLCAALGDGELIEDPRFASTAARAANNSELIALFDAMSAALDHETLLAGLAANGVSAAPVNTLADVVKDPQAWDNDYLVKAWCEEVQREVDVRGLPVTLSKTPGEVNSLGPAARAGHRAPADGPAGVFLGRDRGHEIRGRDPLKRGVPAHTGEARMSEGETAAQWSDWAGVRGDGLEDFREIIYEKKSHSELRGGVARVTMNKPGKFNTMTLAHRRRDVPRLLRREPRRVDRRDDRRGEAASTSAPAATSSGSAGACARRSTTATRTTA